MATQSVELAPPSLPQASTRCPECLLVQYRKQGRGRCVRCKARLDPPPSFVEQLRFAQMAEYRKLPIQWRLRKIRELKGISQKNLAAASGTIRQHVWKTESVKGLGATISTWQRLCAGLGISMQELLGEEEVDAIARRTFAAGGTASEIVQAVAEILPRLSRASRTELLAILRSFKRGQLSFTEYMEVGRCRSRRARAPRSSTATSTK